MMFIVIGISHKTAAVKIREKFSFTAKHRDEALAKLRSCGLVSGAVILSTCNRTEIYASIAEENFPLALDFIFSIFGASPSEQKQYFYLLREKACLEHLFKVVSGLDSQVLGETQILGQVKSGWVMAYQKGLTDRELDEIFQKALALGRRVRRETKISQGNVSVGSVAIDLLEKKFSDLARRSVLIIGAGKVGALVSKYLKDKNMAGIFVASRTYSRALEMANACSGRAVDFSRLEQELAGVDIVISSTSSPHIVLKKEMMERIMRLRANPLFIMDLALPRDVDAEVKAIAGVNLCDLDDLKSVVSENQKKKEIEAAAAEKIIAGELTDLLEVVL